MHVRAELVSGCGPSHRRHHPVSHHERADVPTAALGDELLDEHVLLGRVQRLDDRLSDLHLRREDDADPLRALEELDDDRSAADALDGGPHIGAVAHERRGRHRDVVAREDLVRAELVAGTRDPVRRVRRVHVHLLELADHCCAEVGDRVADSGQDRVVVAELTPAVVQVRLVGREIDREAQRVKHFDVVTSLERGGAQPLEWSTPAARGRALRSSRGFPARMVG